MVRGFDIPTLASLYDIGCLVPFTGSGMSRGECQDWAGFVDQLARHAGVVDALIAERHPIRRAAAALDSLRRSGKDIGDAVRQSVYLKDGYKPSHNQALARLHWPLLCTTNYDDVYVSEALRLRKTLPRVRGRSESDCRRVLQHMSLPAGEIVWALQGFLEPRTMEAGPCLGADTKALESELVVGPVEYRNAAHLSPHFRRCFSEVFRHRSILFLGTGLSEPYILNLFDEIIALVGPPSRPHFALVEEDSLDVNFMRDHYHIVCNTYPKGAHEEVSDLLRNLESFLQSERARPQGWSYRLNTPAFVNHDHHAPHFQVVRAPLPLPSQLGTDEVIAISCGRECADHRGIPIPSSLIEERVPAARLADLQWLDDWTVSWDQATPVYGVVARDLCTDNDWTSRDARSPEAVRLAFKAFLRQASSRGVTKVHAQLLGAGRHRVFWPWISLVQMARAYGQWAKEEGQSSEPLSVTVYVVAPDVIALLSGGQLHMTEHLQDLLLRFNVEVIDAFGCVQTHQEVAAATDRLGALAVFSSGPSTPYVHAVPSPRLLSEPKPLSSWMRNTELRDFGLVSGSTLVVDYTAIGSRVRSGRG